MFVSDKGTWFARGRADASVVTAMSCSCEILSAFDLCPSAKCDFSPVLSEPFIVRCNLLGALPVTDILGFELAGRSDEFF